jgi:carbamoyltransferase
MQQKNKRTYYLGFCATYHDPALAILDEAGHILFAEATERFLQYKRALNAEPDNLYLLPELLQRYCPDAEAFVVAGNWRDSRPLYERLAAGLGWLSPRGLLGKTPRPLVAPVPTFQLHHMMASQRQAIQRRNLNLARILRTDFPAAAVTFRDFDHHLTHAALACYGSPGSRGVCAVIDSYGEEGALAYYAYRDGRITPLFRSRGAQSPGFYYMKLTELCGFDWMSGEEWKVMGLAAYGQPDETILMNLRALLSVNGLDLARPQPQSHASLLRHLERYRRDPATPPETAATLAASGQHFFAEVLYGLLNGLHRYHPEDHLLLAGGCALNSSANGRILSETPFESLFIPPAPADDGTALGAALLAWQQDHPGQTRSDTHLSPYLGHAIPQKSIERVARYSGLPVSWHPGGQIAEIAARRLAEGDIMGWVQGRAELGPRALGNRSILADPRTTDMGERINRDVKFRERFRPYAPAILDEWGPDYFLDYQASPYMERTLKFRPAVREQVPAVVHADGSGRLQTVRADWNPLFHRLLSAFHQRSGVPVLLNTSFNVMGKPIVHSVEDAVAVFMSSGLDALVLGDFLFTKPGSGSA